jgi:hypothetical protein
MTSATIGNMSAESTNATGVTSVNTAAPGSQNANARLLAFYLPQFHPIPENDKWWGAGFTEWTNVAQARPLFKGHYQPRLPADLGFYDLRVPEVREQQAELARNAGIEGFVYYHYWFGGGRRLLQRPFTEVVASRRPRFPFCLCWANETWSGVWHGASNRVLVEQTYPGRQDIEEHFLALLEAFGDDRHVKVDGKPMFLVYRPLALENRDGFIDQWRALGEKYGLPGFHFVAHLLPHEVGWNYRESGFDGALISNTFKSWMSSPVDILRRHILRDGISRVTAGTLLSFAYRGALHRMRKATGRFANAVSYADAMAFFLEPDTGDPDIYPCVIPNWDNTPRSGFRGVVLHDSTPALFKRHLQETVAAVAERAAERRLIFVKSWNEWAEGNYLEPDRRFGHEYLKVVREVMAG